MVNWADCDLWAAHKSEIKLKDIQLRGSEAFASPCIADRGHPQTAGAAHPRPAKNKTNKSLKKKKNQFFCDFTKINK